MRDNATRASGGERQRRRLLAALRLGPVTTLDARERLHVIHSSARVLELRERGYRILTTWTHEPDAWGRPHRVARYALTRRALKAQA